MVAPEALVRQVHAFFASARGGGDRAIGLENGVLEEGLGLLLPDEQAFFVDDMLKRGDVLDGETAEEITSGGGIGDTLCAKGVQIVFIVAEQFEILEAGAADEDVVGEGKDMVGVMVGEVAFEQMQFGVEGIGEVELLGQ